MGLSKLEATRLRTLITQRVNAAIEHSWRGGKTLAERPQIDKDLAKAEERLEAYIKQLREA